MLQIIYASAASKIFSPEELQEILATARRNNTRLGISGMLLYNTGSFLQVLEGPEAAVTGVFANVANDPRHTNVDLVFRDTVESPEFEQWSMGFVDLTRSSQAQEGYVDYSLELETVLRDKTRAKKTLKRFQQGMWRKLAEDRQ
jgi:hypothetical protein